MVRDNYKEIYVLKVLLEDENIPYEFTEGFLNGCALAYPNIKNIVCSAIEHDGSYGRHEDRIEIMGLLTDEECEYDDVIGGLTAKDVFDRIKIHFETEQYRNSISLERWYKYAWIFSA